MNKAQGIIKLLEANAKTFIIVMEGKDPKEAYSKIMKQVDSMEGASILAQKNDFLLFMDDKKRPASELLDVVKVLLEKDPRFRETDSPAGCFEVEKGKFILFGRGEE